MDINDAGLDIIKRNEGCVLHAYRDIAGVWTIGYGHTGPEVMPGNQITQEQADLSLKIDIHRFVWGISSATKDVPTTENQLSAMVSLAFNIGIGAFRRSSVLRLHRAGDYRGAARAFHMWNKSHVDGQLVVVPGLERRRSEEAALYLSKLEAPSSPTTLPDLNPGQIVDNPPSEADVLNREEYERHLKDGC